MLFQAFRVLLYSWEMTSLIKCSNIALRREVLLVHPSPMSAYEIVVRIGRIFVNYFKK